MFTSATMQNVGTIFYNLERIGVAMYKKLEVMFYYALVIFAVIGCLYIAIVLAIGNFEYVFGYENIFYVHYHCDYQWCTRCS